MNLAATHGEFDQIEQAENCAAEVLRINPEFSIRSYVGDLAYSDPDVAKSFEDSLRKSGLPD